MSRATGRTVLVVAMVAALVAAACDDDGTGVRTIDGSGSASGSASASGPASGSSSASGPAPGAGSASADGGASGELGGYTPVSDVGSHARVVLDVCDINELLPADGTIAYGDIATIYREGAHSRSGDGRRTLAGFASGDLDEPLWNLYEERLGPGWLDDFVTAAIEGTGPFADESDAVRRQGIQKGIQDQIMVAWALHELDAARAKVAAGETDPAEGAPHNVDEIWAFYHGTAPGCAPYGTAERRGADFGTGDAAARAALAATQALQQTALDGDLEGYDTAYDQLLTAVTLPYVQASIKYATNVSNDLAAGDTRAARTHQAEGWAFFRVIEPLVARADAEVADTIVAVFDLANDPAADSGEQVRSAVERVYDALGITAAQVGEYQA